MPGQNAISVIRVERDSTQRLWSVPLDGSAGAPVLERIKPVGYHIWANDTLLALFVLGSPNTLQLASTKSGRGDTIVTGIGRSLHTTKEGQVSFVHKVSNDEWWLTLLDPKNEAAAPAGAHAAPRRRLRLDAGRRRAGRSGKRAEVV